MFIWVSVVLNDQNSKNSKEKRPPSFPHPHDWLPVLVASSPSSVLRWGLIVPWGGGQVPERGVHYRRTRREGGGYER